MATGLLVLGITHSTRLLTYIVGVDKEYTATIRLGAATTTDDAEGEVLTRATTSELTKVEIVREVSRLTGEIQQVPSSVSAIKVDGKRAYARVRSGEAVELAARQVTVSAFELLGSTVVEQENGLSALDLQVRVECSSGTYVRALARDLGARLSVGGHLIELRRTRVGPFSVSDASPLDSIDVASSLISPANAARSLFDVFALTQKQAIDLGHGKRIHADGDEPRPGIHAAIAPDGHLVGLIGFSGGEGRTVVNFPTDQSPNDANPS